MGTRIKHTARTRPISSNRLAGDMGVCRHANRQRRPRTVHDERNIRDAVGDLYNATKVSITQVTQQQRNDICTSSNYGCLPALCGNFHNARIATRNSHMSPIKDLETEDIYTANAMRRKQLSYQKYVAGKRHDSSWQPRQVLLPLADLPEAFCARSLHKIHSKRDERSCIQCPKQAIHRHQSTRRRSPAYHRQDQQSLTLTT